jgi:hypothetical protein
MPSHPRFVGYRWRRGGVRRMHSVDKILQQTEGMRRIQDGVFLNGTYWGRDVVAGVAKAEAK